MTEVISVRFKDKGKIYFFDPNGLEIESGVHVIVETTKGLEYAECTYGNHMVEDTAVFPPLRPVIRIATDADKKKAAENKAKEAEAFKICQEKIDKREMDMKLVDVEYNFEGNKILFFFTSDGRVDFRDLVKDLASVFKTRIELRQIGVRDEARMLGGLGICGKPFCCSQFLDEFHPVSIKMAKTQGLSLNPTKISGTCGRLMCCLKYEQVAYEDLVKKAPKVDAFVDTPAGKGSVVSVNLLRGNAKVRLEDTADATQKTFVFDDLEILGGKARRAEYIAAKAEGRLEEAGFKPSNIRQAKQVDIPKANDITTSRFSSITQFDEMPQFANIIEPEPEVTETPQEQPKKQKSRRYKKKPVAKPEQSSKQAQTPQKKQQENAKAEQSSANESKKPQKKHNSKSAKPQKKQVEAKSAVKNPAPKPTASKTSETDQPKTPKKTNYRRYRGKRPANKKQSDKPAQNNSTK